VQNGSVSASPKLKNATTTMTDLSTLPDRALSIRQPWAWAILYAGKRVENRTRRFNHRGPICIHAANGMTKGEFDDFVDLARTMNRSGAWQPDALVPFPDELQRGGIIGTAEIVDCAEASDSPWFFGPFGLVLTNVQPIPFIPVRGALGLFQWKRNLECHNG
jgi:hypothetical protein